jgi:hypothetical protein
MSLKLTNKVKHRKTTTTRRNKLSTGSDISQFQKEITVHFLETLLMIKLFHWKTISYATHKATDELYEKFNSNMDSFVEILLGKSGSRVDLTKVKTIKIVDFKNQNEFKLKIEEFKLYLVNLDNNKAMKLMKNSDLYNIRDTILGDMNQLLYLLTFS